jgi:formylglycine-generating enzyme required for sulfatase activity
MYPPSYWQKQLGKWFGSKYLLKEFLGCGAYGAVFRADEMLAERVMQSVAIKIVIADMDNLDNQLAELQLSVRLRHPHLINGITCEQGEIFGDLCLGLVMELADDTLEGYYAKQSQGLSVETVTTITQHLAAGLSALHEDGITHRDLKPANVLLVKDLWKLGDFGIARSLQDKTSTYTNASQQIGTVAYMPPEAYSGKISPAWDVWALGVMVHQLASGQHPFPTQIAPELMRMVLMEDPQIDPKLSSPLREIVAGCLIKEPKERWSGEQVLGALRPQPVVQVPQPLPPIFPLPQPVTPVIQPVTNNTLFASLVARFGPLPVTPVIHPSPRALTTIRENLGGWVSLELIQLPAGQFMMGASDNDNEAHDHEKPQHLVTVKAFAIGKYPITQAQYKAVMGNNPSRFQGLFKGNSRHPVESVSWDNAKDFCEKLSRKTGKKYRLPSEAEWEYASRAGMTTRHYFGNYANQLGDYAWFWDNSGRETHPVGEKKPNPWGLYDMHGNVWEWCEDTWHDNYRGAPNNGRAWINRGGGYRVLRGGCWIDYSRYCRLSSRGRLGSDIKYYRYGFRVAFSL